MKRMKFIFGLLFCGLLLTACFAPKNSEPLVTIQSVSSTTPTNNAKPTSVRSLVINYASEVNRVSAEQALTLYAGDYDVTQNPVTFTKLTLTSICDGYWRASNANTVPISFNWDIEGGTEKAVGVAQPGSTYFYSSKGTKTLRVLVGAALQQKKAQVATACTTQGIRTFAWDTGSLKLTQTFAPRPLGKYTLVVSTGLVTTTGANPANPYISKFSVIRNPNLPKISLSSPIAFGGGGFNFEAYGAGVDGSTYSWNFGDGTSQTGEAVYKTYTNPGLYTVTLSVTSPTGTVTTAKTTVAQHKNIHDAPSTRANSTNKTFTFDAGANLPGFVYQWNFGDGKSAIGYTVTKTYTALGFYDVELKVIDNRTEEAKLVAQGYTQGEIEELKAEGLLSDLEAQAVTPVVAAVEPTRVNSWKTKPSAKFTATTTANPGSVAMGRVPFTVNFDASTSTSSSTATYTWDFGDGSPTVTGTTPTTSHTYTIAGRYMITLSVKDADNQVDTANTYVFAWATNLKILTGVTYKVTTPALMAEWEKIQAESETSSNLNSLSEGLEPQAVATFASDYPYVIHKDVASIRTTFYPLAGVFVKADLSAFRNGIQVTPNVTPGINGVPDTNGNYTQIQFTNTAYTKPLTTGTNLSSLVYQLAGGTQEILQYYQVFAGLRVPRVVISILPDEQLPGNMPSPILTENTVQVNGKTELMLQVNIRESEAAAGFAEFEVPVYGVNDTGSQMSNLDGLFKARFTQVGVESSVVDGVMIDGKAYIKVKVPLSTYANGSTQLDLTTVQLYAANQTCDAQSLYDFAPGVIPGVTGGFAFCNTLTASYEAPVGSAVPVFAYTLPADYLTRTNRVYLGKDTAEQTKYDNNVKDVPGDVARLVLGFIPILGDGVDFIEQAVNSAIGANVDEVMITLAAAGLILDLTTGGIADISAPVKGIYRFSRDFASGALADGIKEIVQQGIIAGKGSTAILNDLNTLIGVSAKLIWKCGFECLGKTDGISKALIDEGSGQAADTFKRIEQMIKDTEAVGGDGATSLKIVDGLRQQPCLVLNTLVPLAGGCVDGIISQLKSAESAISSLNLPGLGAKEVSGLFAHVCCKLNIEGSRKLLDDLVGSINGGDVKGKIGEIINAARAKKVGLKPIKLASDNIGNNVDADMISEVITSSITTPGTRFAIDQVKAGNSALGGARTQFMNLVTNLQNNSSGLCNAIPSCNNQSVGGRFVYTDVQRLYTSVDDFIANSAIPFSKADCLAAEAVNAFIIFTQFGPNDFSKQFRVDCNKLP